MGTYVIGDIHGCFNEFIQLKNKILRKDKDAVFILVGDIVDRGPQVYRMLSWCRRNITEDGRFQMILGNHEYEKIYWLEDFFRRIKNTSFRQAKKHTFYDNYDFAEMLLYRGTSQKEFVEIYDFLKSLPLYKKLKIKNKEYIISHAYMPSEILDNKEKFNSLKYLITRDENGKRVVDRTQESIVWDRLKPVPRKNTVFIVGHTPTVVDFEWNFTPGKVYQDGDFYDIDCGVVFREQHGVGNLAALCLETMKITYLFND